MPNRVPRVVAEPRDRKEAWGGVLSKGSVFAKQLVGVMHGQEGVHDNAVAKVAKVWPICCHEMMQVPIIALLTGVWKGGVTSASCCVVRDLINGTQRGNKKPSKLFNGEVRLEVASWNPPIALKAKVMRGKGTELHGRPRGSSSKVELRGLVLCAPKNRAEGLSVIEEHSGSIRNGEPKAGCILEGAC